MAINTGSTVQNACDVRAALPETNIFGASVNAPYCENDPGFITKVTGLGSYTVPKIDVLFGVTFRSDQGAPLRAIWNAPTSTVTAALGRPAVGVGNTIPIDLIAPGEQWGDRVNEIDLRFAKIFRFGGTRTHVGIDIFNLLNSDAILTYNQTFTPGRRLAGAAVGPDAALREGERADRLLVLVAGGSWFLEGRPERAGPFSLACPPRATNNH